MCGRYYCGPDFSERLEELLEEIDARVESEDVKAVSAGDVFPSTEAVTIAAPDDDGKLAVETMRWGFTAPFDKKLLINARSETVREKKTFSDSVEKRRCVIPASGFYEWNKQKTRYRFFSDDGELLLLAGIFREEPDGRKYTILTTDANDSMRPVHSRMPVIVRPEEIRTWILDDSAYPAILHREQAPLVRESDDGQMMLDLGI